MCAYRYVCSNARNTFNLTVVTTVTLMNSMHDINGKTPQSPEDTSEDNKWLHAENPFQFLFRLVLLFF